MVIALLHFEPSECSGTGHDLLSLYQESAVALTLPPRHTLMETAAELLLPR